MDLSLTQKKQTLVDAYPMFNADECEALAAKALELSETHGIDRGVFTTLGFASYLDGRVPRATALDISNSALLGAFLSLYVAVGRRLETITGKTPHIAASHPLPGFHIFDARAADEDALAHVDWQYKKTFDEVPIANVSFTLPLQLPVVGGGCNFWPEADAADPTLDWNDGRGVLPEMLGEPEFVPYQVGTLYVHGGDVPHQIANVNKAKGVPLKPGEYRITLQGHGAILPDNKIVMYW